MKNVLFLFLTISMPIFSETQYYNSNKSGMILDEINQKQTKEFYIVKESNDETWSYKYSFIKNGVIKTLTEEFYSSDYVNLLNKEITEGSKKNIEYYDNNIIIKNEEYKKSILLSSTLYHYNSKRQLLWIEQLGPDNIQLYKEQYYRNSDNSLRKILRSNLDGYYIHWFYNDGLVVESWLIEDKDSTRTKFNLDGALSSITNYINNEIESKEEYRYKDDSTLDFSVKTSGDFVTQKMYNADGSTSEIREFKNDILIKNSRFEYNDKLLERQVITGHGKKEEFIYSRNDDDEIKIIIYKINGILNQKTIIQSKEFEIFEYYRDGVIYLKEYYTNGEKTQRDLFLDGELFKSENFSE